MMATRRLQEESSDVLGSKVRVGVGEGTETYQAGVGRQDGLPMCRLQEESSDVLGSKAGGLGRKG